IKCRNLKAMDLNGKSDPYVKMVIFLRDSIILKEKSSVQKCTLNPEFNLSVRVCIGQEEIYGIRIHISMMDYNKILKNRIIGKVILGPTGSGILERKTFNTLLNSPKEPIVQWLKLKPNIT
ncbi:unnamed protein product, partial [Meganyctiphanes norvegica]